MAKNNDLLAEPAAEAPLPGQTGLEDTLSPVDLPPMGEESHPLRWASIVIATATAFLALFNASALQGWAYELAPGRYTRPVVEIADGWYRLTARIGLDVPVRTMSGWWEGLTRIEFGGNDVAAAAPREDAAPPPPGSGELGADAQPADRPS